MLDFKRGRRAAPPRGGRSGVSVESRPEVARAPGLQHAGPHCRPAASCPVTRASWFCVSEGGKQTKASGQNPQGLHKCRRGAPGSPAGRDSRGWRARDGCGCSVCACPSCTLLRLATAILRQWPWHSSPGSDPGRQSGVLCLTVSLRKWSPLYSSPTCRPREGSGREV